MAIELDDSLDRATLQKRGRFHTRGLPRYTLHTTDLEGHGTFSRAHDCPVYINASMHWSSSIFCCFRTAINHEVPCWRVATLHLAHQMNAFRKSQQIQIVSQSISGSLLACPERFHVGDTPHGRANIRLSRMTPPSHHLQLHRHLFLLLLLLLHSDGCAVMRNYAR